MRSAFLLALLAPALVLLAPAPAAQSALDTPQTRAERSGFRQTSTYADVRAFLGVLEARSDRLHLTTFGETAEGRALPLAVVGAPAATPQSVRSAGKARVLIVANIHAGEVAGKEAALALLRELARGEHENWTDRLVLLVAPVYNADGNERVDSGNRPYQHGPVGGMGQRPNAQGLDLNRDLMKLDAPESRALVALMQAYDPDLVLDLHTTSRTRRRSTRPRRALPTRSCASACCRPSPTRSPRAASSRGTTATGPASGASPWATAPAGTRSAPKGAF